MLINLSNHPYECWTVKQKEQAQNQFGYVIDILHPEISPETNELEVEHLANDVAKDILKKNPKAVHVMGEHTFCFSMVRLLQKEGIKCIASTSKRICSENEDGTVNKRFEFVRFRTYPRF